MIVHIGYPKTGTTFLQNGIFPNMEGLIYTDYKTCKKLFQPLISETSLSFDPNQFQLHSSPQALYSLESLVGAMGTGVYDYEIAQRLKALGFKKIIITIRRQDKMLESLYRQYIQQGGVQKPMAFVQDSDYFRWSFLNYSTLITHYAKLFGRENVFVFCQEELKENASAVLERLKTFCEASAITSHSEKKAANTSLSRLAIQWLRVVNHFTYNVYRRSSLISKKFTTWKFRNLLQSKLDPILLRRLSSKKDFYDSVFANDVLKRYQSDNRNLNQEFDLKLDTWSYFPKDN